jgi:hypothetical protein
MKSCNVTRMIILLKRYPAMQFNHPIKTRSPQHSLRIQSQPRRSNRVRSSGQAISFGPHQRQRWRTVRCSTSASCVKYVAAAFSTGTLVRVSNFR